MRFGVLGLVAFRGVSGCEEVLLKGEQKGVLGREGAREVRVGVLERESAKGRGGRNTSFTNAR